MKLTPSSKRIKDVGYRYEIEGDLISSTYIDLTSLDKPIYVSGSIKAGGFIKAGGSIEAGEFIKAGGSIKAGGFIKAGGSIEAGESIEAGWSIEAGGFIEAGESIEAGERYGIQAGLYIKSKGVISFGLKIFAGLCTRREVSDKEKTIECEKIEGGGVVEYGILKLIEQDKITIKINGQEIELSEETIKELKKKLI